MPQQGEKLNYHFAHHVLRDAIFATDLQDLRWIVQNREFADFCSQCVQDCFESEDDLEAIMFEADLGIFEVLHEEDFQMVLISLPTPEAVTEAHYVLIALTGAIRYFTLEATTELFSDSPERLNPHVGIFGEWTVDGAHHNYGDCPLHPTKFVSHAVRKLRNLRHS